jgi:NADPH:quinone reductase-like Zn-dependent oxidoreductase
MPLIEAGKLKLMIEAIYPWTDIVEAHKLMESNTTKGKIICNVST